MLELDVNIELFQRVKKIIIFKCAFRCTILVDKVLVSENVLSVIVFINFEFSRNVKKKV